MPALYNCKSMHSTDMYNITKFDDDLNVVSSYITTITGDCDCPAGVRPICRHREMLPKFLERKTVDTGWWFDYDRGGWVQMGEEWATPADLHYRDVARLELNDRLGPHRVAANPADFDSANGGSNPPVAAKPQFLEGITQSISHTFIYTTDEAPLPITGARLNVSTANIDEPSRPLPPAHYPSWRRI